MNTLITISVDNIFVYFVDYRGIIYSKIAFTYNDYNQNNK